MCLCLFLAAAVRGDLGYIGDRAVGKAMQGEGEKEGEKEDEGGEFKNDCW